METIGSSRHLLLRARRNFLFKCKKKIKTMNVHKTVYSSSFFKLKLAQSKLVTIEGSNARGERIAIGFDAAAPHNASAWVDRAHSGNTTFSANFPLHLRAPLFNATCEVYVIFGMRMRRRRGRVLRRFVFYKEKNTQFFTSFFLHCA